MRYISVLLLGFMLAACSSPSTKADDSPQMDLEEAARINTQLGMDYLRQGNLASAEEKLKRALTQDPDLADAHVVLAILYSRKGQDDVADKHFREALSLAPNNPDALNNYGTFLCSRKRIADGEKYFIRAAQNPEFKRPELAWTNAAVCLREAQPEKSEQYLREALKANPGYPDALAQFALICYRKSDYLRARAFLQRYEAVAQPSPQTLWVRAKTEAALGDAAAAIRYEQQLKTQFPEVDPDADISDLSVSTP
jgi:type IV pilus assembly protein PilF